MGIELQIFYSMIKNFISWVNWNLQGKTYLGAKNSARKNWIVDKA